MNCSVPVSALILGVLLTGMSRAADSASSEKKPQAVESELQPAPEDDLKSVQGLWVRTETVGLFGKRRITKEIQGDRETLTYHDAIGGIERAHQVKVALRRAGPIRVFAYSEQVFTEGPDKGNRVEGGNAYVYKIVGDTFIEIWGVLGDDDRELEVMRWQRAKR
jgi:hypothetical protein